MDTDAYIKQLEALILYTLLPVYDKYYAKSNGFERKIPLDEDLIHRIKQPKRNIARILQK